MSVGGCRSFLLLVTTLKFAANMPMFDAQKLSIYIMLKRRPPGFVAAGTKHRSQVIVLPIQKVS